ncbi:MAG: hypothetical protein RSF94_07020 [Rikenellaceae bacterium]
MGSIKNLKKDINYLTEAVCSDCYTCSFIQSNVDTDKIAEIISNALTFRQELIYKINNPENKEDKKAVAKHYKALKAEAMEKFDSLFESLSKLIK